MDDALLTYQAERDRHGRRLDGTGCRCGVRLSGWRLTAHLSATISAASAAYSRSRTGVTP